MNWQGFLGGFLVFGADVLLLAWLLKQLWIARPYECLDPEGAGMSGDTEGAVALAHDEEGWPTWQRSALLGVLALGKGLFLLAGVVACLQVAKLPPLAFLAGAVAALSFFVGGVFLAQSRSKPATALEEKAVLCGVAGVKSGLK